MPLRSSPSIARSRRAESLNFSDVNFNFVDVNPFDLCSNGTVNGLITTACDLLAMDGNTTSGNPTRAVQEHLKNCIDAIRQQRPGRAGHSVSVHVPESAGAVPVTTEV
jgi:hypothetical protein